MDMILHIVVNTNILLLISLLTMLSLLSEYYPLHLNRELRDRYLTKFATWNGNFTTCFLYPGKDPHPQILAADSQKIMEEIDGESETFVPAPNHENNSSLSGHKILIQLHKQLPRGE